MICRFPMEMLIFALTFIILATGVRINTLCHYVQHRYLYYNLTPRHKSRDQLDVVNILLPIELI